jgi:hypothetical protein
VKMSPLHRLIDHDAQPKIIRRKNHRSHEAPS